jgi:hypothetical protein
VFIWFQSCFSAKTTSVLVEISKKNFILLVAYLILG